VRDAALEEEAGLEKLFDRAVGGRSGGGGSGGGPLTAGDRVRRGPDWQWSDQDGGVGGLGTVLKIDQCGSIEVKWDRTGGTNSYRTAALGGTDLVRASSTGGDDDDGDDDNDEEDGGGGGGGGLIHASTTSIHAATADFWAGGKKPVTGFMKFSAERRPTLKAEQPDLTFGGVRLTVVPHAPS
jgi:hypothetical protein